MERKQQISKRWKNLCRVYKIIIYLISPHYWRGVMILIFLFIYYFGILIFITSVNILLNNLDIRTGSIRFNLCNLIFHFHGSRLLRI